MCVCECVCMCVCVSVCAFACEFCESELGGERKTSFIFHAIRFSVRCSLALAVSLRHRLAGGWISLLVLLADLLTGSPLGSNSIISLARFS